MRTPRMLLKPVKGGKRHFIQDAPFGVAGRISLCAWSSQRTKFPHNQPNPQPAHQTHRNPRSLSAIAVLDRRIVDMLQNISLACALVCFVLALSVVEAQGQVPAPRSYLFVDVKNTAGQPVTDANIAVDRKSTRLNSSHTDISRMPS